MAVYAIGDVQGCFRELQTLLRHIDFSPSRDRLWFAGDLVNRGPASLETLRFVRDLGDDAVTVLGNHDLHLIASWYNPAGLKRKDTLRPVLEAEDGRELIRWLCRQPLIHREPGLEFTLLHAGLPPQWDLDQAVEHAEEVQNILRGPELGAFLDVMYGNQPELWSDELRGHDRLRFITNCFTRLRYCSPEGRLALNEKGPPGSQPPGYYPWFDIETRRSAGERILFGHWSTLGDHRSSDVFPLDSGCLWGGRLTALRLDKDPEWIRIDCPGERRPEPET